MWRPMLAVALLGMGACFEDPVPLDPSNDTSGTTAAGSSSTGLVLESGSEADETSDETSDEIADVTTTEPADTSAGDPVCGNAELEGDELCDDGNDVPADGCTACRPSLTAAWIRTFGSDTPIEAALAVHAAPDATVVAGSLGGVAGDPDLWLEVLDDDGESLGHMIVGGTADAADSMNDVCVAPDGSIRATGSIRDEASADAQIDTRVLTPMLDVGWTAQSGTDLGPDRGLGLGVVDGGTVVGGTLGRQLTTDAWFGHYDDTGALVDEYTCDCGAAGSVLQLVASDAGPRALVSSGSANALWQFDGPLTDGPTASATINATGSVLALDVTPNGDVIVCGDLSGGNDVSLWLARFDASADEVWTVSHDIGDGDQTCRDVAIDTGDLVAVGDIRENENAARGFVARVDFATGALIGAEEIVVEGSEDTRVLAVDMDEGVPTVAGAYAVNALDDDAFVARLVP